MDEATNKPAEGADSSAVLSLHEDVGYSGAPVSAGPGAEPSKEQGQPAASSVAAPDAGKAAPAQGTTVPPATEQPKPWKIKAENLPEDRMKFFKDKGYLLEDGHIDADKWHKSTVELERFSTESRQAIANFKSQLSSFQTAKVEEKPVTKEEVNQNYRETVQNIQAINGVIQRMQSNQATPQDVAVLAAWAGEMTQNAEAEREEALENLREADVAKKYGLVPKGVAELEAPESARQKASENVLAILKPEEQSAQNINKILGNPHTLALLNNLAAAMFPREYNTGKTEEEIAKNNQTAVNRVLAKDPELAKSFVELGRAANASQNFAAAITDADKKGYERGKADALKTLNAGGSQPGGANVRKFGSGEGTKVVSALHAELR